MSDDGGINPLADAWLPAVRVAWLVVAASVLILLIPEIQITASVAHHPCILPDCNNPQIPFKAARALQNSGMSLDAYAAYYVALVLVVVAVCYAIAGVLIWRPSGDRMVLLTSFALVLFCTSAGIPVRGASGVWFLPSEAIGFLGAVTGSLLLYVFPTGRFVPRWTALLAAGFIALSYISLPQSLLSLALFFGFLVSILVLQIYRFRKVSTPVQRQQTKLVVLGIALFCLIQIALGIMSQAVPWNQAVIILLLGSISILSPLVFIGSIGLAVLRHGLWDVDVIINRTLVYLALSVSLALVYVTGVVGMQFVFRLATGRQSDLAVAISTLLIAALFNPLRRRIQDLIARTFYRRKYNAAQVLAAFGAACRDETDLETLQANLVRVVGTTMQPAHVSLWLRERRARA